MISPQRDGEPMGTHPAHAPSGEPAPMGFEALASALSKLGDSPPPLSEAAVDRIQSRIFAEASTAVVELPLLPRTPEPDIAPEVDIDEADFDSWTEELAQTDRPQPNTKRLLPSALAGFLAAMLVATLAFLGARGAEPGSLTYPLKLKLEQMSLNRVAPGIPAARAHLGIATTRFEELRSLRKGTPQTLDELTIRMDKAGLKALTIAAGAPESPERIEVLSDLLALAMSENRFLASRMPVADRSVIGSLARSYATSARIIRQASSLLAAYGTVPSLSVLNDVMTPSTITITPSEGGRGSVRTVPQAGSSQPKDDPVTDTGAKTPEPPSEAPCDLQGGEVCVRIPNLESIPTNPLG